MSLILVGAIQLRRQLKPRPCGIKLLSVANNAIVPCAGAGLVLVVFASYQRTAATVSRAGEIFKFSAKQRGPSSWFAWWAHGKKLRQPSVVDGRV